MKKALALLLVLVLALGMSTVAFAATQKVEKDYTKQGGTWYGTTWNVPGGTAAPTDYYDMSDIHPNNNNNKISIPLMAANFTKSDVKATNGSIQDWASSASTLSKNEIKASKMSAKAKASKGSQVIDTVEIDGTNVIVKFVEPFASNNPDGVDFEFRVYLVVDGKNWTDGAITFVGNYSNHDEEGDADTDYYDFSDGRILKPTEFIRMFDGDLGEGVVVNMRGLKNAKYWGVANQDISDADQDNMIKYPEIDQVIHVKQIGIAPVTNFVTLEDADPTSYVYDKDFNLLGRGNGHLPLVDTYYLASAEIDAAATDEEPEEETEEADGDYEVDEGDNSGTGGDDLYPENPHDNPGTGK